MRFTIIFAICIGLFLAGCKREVANQIPNLSMGITYPLPGSQVIYGSVKAPDGGYLLWGYTKDITGAQDAFLMKLDKDQQLVWQKTIGGTEKDEFRSACFDSQGNILAAGFSNHYDSIKQTIGFPTMLTVYLSGNGGVIWQNQYSAPSNEPNKSTIANKVLYLPNGNFALIGNTTNYAFMMPFINFVQYVQCAFILYINSKGDTLRSSRYDVLDDRTEIGKAYNNIYGVNGLVTNDNNVLLLITKSANYFDSLRPDGYFRDTYFTGGTTFVKIDPNLSTGNNSFIWRKTNTNLNITGFGAFSVPFLKASSVEGGYWMAVKPKSMELPLYAHISDEANLLSMPISYTSAETNESSIMQLDGSSIWIGTDRIISKLNKNGNYEWTRSFNEMTNLSGIYPQSDGSLVVFCTTEARRFETDITCLKLNSKGEFLK